MRIAIVENTRVTHHGQVGVALHEAGAVIDLFRPYEGQPLPAGPGAHDGIVVFGGEQTALDDATHPYLPELARLMAAFSGADKAVLGICLGAQVLARGLGAQNLLGAAPEFGWCDVALTGAAADDPVLAGLPQAFPIFQWHSDSFTLPPGAVHLASSAMAAQQAFRVGRATYGFQFHFEANRAVVADWVRRFPDLVEGHEAGFAGRLAERGGREGVIADAAGLAIARGWVGVIQE
ncbi:MAG: type 1 glutamine amidotransferase [Gemmobacter sp.]